MLNKAFAKEVEKNLPGRIYFLWSNEGCFLDEALRMVSDTVLGAGPSDFNYDVFDSSSGPNEIIDAASTLPFMSTRRLVLVKDFHELTAAGIKQLQSYLTTPLQETCMVITSRKAPRATIKAAWKVFSFVLKDWDIPGWLRHEASTKGLSLSSEAVEYMVDYIGYDVGMLMMELEKFRLSGKAAISGKDVMELTSMVRDFTPFDLINAVVSGQKARAFRILRKMLSGGSTESPQVILGTLNWHYKQFYALWSSGGVRPAKMQQKTYTALSKHL
ncbi:DNA polymerase III subunit delta, partial [bacterium]|nr:DNA polymerase III subunit delta [bacterium]